jgi:hypothetical protein
MLTTCVILADLLDCLALNHLPTLYTREAIRASPPSGYAVERIAGNI